MDMHTLGRSFLCQQRGFTLIELLIVIAIIGILAAVGVPQYSNYLDRSEQSACVAELSSFRVLAIVPEGDNDADTSVDEFEFQSCVIDGDGTDLVDQFKGINDSVLSVGTQDREQTVFVTVNGRISTSSEDA